MHSGRSIPWCTADLSAITVNMYVNTRPHSEEVVFQKLSFEPGCEKKRPSGTKHNISHFIRFFHYRKYSFVCIADLDSSWLFCWTSYNCIQTFSCLRPGLFSVLLPSPPLPCSHGYILMLRRLDITWPWDMHIVIGGNKKCKTNWRC